MSSADRVFQPVSDNIGDQDKIASALSCIEAFTACFNARDLDGMDARLHFPHLILSAEKFILWQKPGQLPDGFFDDLAATTGWHHTTYHEKRAVLVSPNKVHMFVDYSRDREDGSIISRHENLWIITFDDGRWGIKQRSY